MNRSLLPAIGLFTILASVPAAQTRSSAADFDTAALSDFCSTPNSSACVLYFQGFLHGRMSTMVDGLEFCLGDHSVGELIAIFQSFAASRPEYEKTDPVITVAFALQRRFPC